MRIIITHSRHQSPQHHTCYLTHLYNIQQTADANLTNCISSKISLNYLNPYRQMHAFFELTFHQNPFSACPGFRWGNLRCSHRHLVGWEGRQHPFPFGRGHPSPFPPRDAFGVSISVASLWGIGVVECPPSPNPAPVSQ